MFTDVDLWKNNTIAENTCAC